MSGASDATKRIGYCPYCGATLRVLDDPHQGGYQVTCGCRNVVVPYAQAPQGTGLRRAWEIMTRLRSKYDG